MTLLTISAATETLVLRGFKRRDPGDDGGYQCDNSKHWVLINPNASPDGHRHLVVMRGGEPYAGLRITFDPAGLAVEASAYSAFIGTDLCTFDRPIESLPELLTGWALINERLDDLLDATGGTDIELAPQLEAVLPTDWRLADDQLKEDWK